MQKHNIASLIHLKKGAGGEVFGGGDVNPTLLETKIKVLQYLSKGSS